MTSATRPAPSAESYATFWEPVAVDVPRAPARPDASAADAYQDFVNVAEDTPADAPPARA